MVMASILGQMERSIMENGKKESNMVKESSLILKEKVKLVYGRMARGKNGLMMEKVIIYF